MSARKRCPIDGKWFVPARSHARTCSDRCRQRAYRLRRRIWSGDAEGKIFVDGRLVGTIPQRGTEWSVSGKEWGDRPPLEGFKPTSMAGEAAQSNPARGSPWERRGARRAFDLLEETRQLGRLGGLARLAGDLAHETSWEARDQWLLMLADASEAVAGEAREMAAGRPVAFLTSGSKIHFTDDGVAPTLTKADAAEIVVWQPPGEPEP